MYQCVRVIGTVEDGIFDKDFSILTTVIDVFPRSIICERELIWTPANHVAVFVM
jgi:hypothetical protein